MIFCSAAGTKIVFGWKWFDLRNELNNWFEMTLISITITSNFDKFEIQPIQINGNNQTNLKSWTNSYVYRRILIWESIWIKDLKWIHVEMDLKSTKMFQKITCQGFRIHCQIDLFKQNNGFIIMDSRYLASNSWIQCRI